MDLKLISLALEKAGSLAEFNQFLERVGPILRQEAAATTTQRAAIAASERHARVLETASAKPKPARGRRRAVNKGNPWTPRLNRQLLDFANEGMRPGKIARVMGRTRAAVEVQLYKIGFAGYRAIGRSAIPQPGDSQLNGAAV